MKFLRSTTAEDRLVILSLFITFSGIILGAILREPRSYGFTAILVIAILTVGTYLIRSPRLSWLLVFGAIAGVLELWADWIHAASLHSLVYIDYSGLKLLESPWYMLIGWCLTCVQFGYIALRLSERWSNEIAVAIISIMGMLLPPWYEEFAKPARAWYYTTHHFLISNTPLWIILTYGGWMHVWDRGDDIVMLLTQQMGARNCRWYFYSSKFYVVSRFLVYLVGITTLDKV